MDLMMSNIINSVQAQGQNVIIMIITLAKNQCNRGKIIKKVALNRVLVYTHFSRKNKGAKYV